MSNALEKKLTSREGLDVFFAIASELAQGPDGGFFEAPFSCNYEILKNHPEVQRSPELDYGVHWHTYDPGTRVIFSFPSFRVSWIENLGILYAVELHPDSKQCYLIGYFPDREAVEKAMKGWSEPGATIENTMLIQGFPDGFRASSYRRSR